MISPSHELLIRTEPSDVAFLPTRIVEHAKTSPTVQANDVTNATRTVNLANLLSVSFIIVLP
jgi:hypothetical protein